MPFNFKEISKLEKVIALKNLVAIVGIVSSVTVFVDLHIAPSRQVIF